MEQRVIRVRDGAFTQLVRVMGQLNPSPRLLELARSASTSIARTVSGRHEDDVDTVEPVRQRPRRVAPSASSSDAPSRATFDAEAFDVALDERASWNDDDDGGNGDDGDDGDDASRVGPRGDAGTNVARVLDSAFGDS